MDALDRVAQVVLRLGDRVVVEHPAFPPLLDLLDQLGCEVVGVDVDDDGLSRRRAARGAAPTARAAVFLQPRAQNPAGVGDDAARAAALADVLGRQRRDRDRGRPRQRHLRGAAGQPRARGCPTRTVHIRSYSKSHGPDLRLAAVGGAGDVVTAVANRRLLGPGWSSRILQALLARAAAGPGDAGGDGRGARRRTPGAGRSCPRCSAADGVAVTGTDGINLWMRVADERSAAVALAAARHRRRARRARSSSAPTTTTSASPSA